MGKKQASFPVITGMVTPYPMLRLKKRRGGHDPSLPRPRFFAVKLAAITLLGSGRKYLQTTMYP